MVDLRATADYAEIVTRWMFAYLGFPEQSDAFWEDWAAALTADMADLSGLYSNAAAVMADGTQPIALAEES